MICLLFLGDIFGRPGRRIVCALLPELRREYEPSLVIANVENAAGGAGISPKPFKQLRAAGIEVMTSGNHIWDQRPGYELIENEPSLLRPLNYPPGAPGRGLGVYEIPSERPGAGCRVGVLNLQGRVFMPNIDCPFRAADAALAEPDLESVAAVFIDFHAEATSEKIALGRYLDGRVAAVVGTHTHVQTADERVLAGGTACLTDTGMCGPLESVIGVKPEEVMPRFLSGLPFRATPADGPAELRGVVIGIDEESGRAVSIERLSRREGDGDE